MYSKDYEIFYNWTNSNKYNDHLQLRTITARMQPLLKKAYSNSEISEILVAEGYKENLVKEALDLATAPAESPVEKKPQANVMPKSYADLAPKIEQVLASTGPSKFVKLLTEGDNPLVKVSKKELDAFQRIADTAYDNKIHLATLHAFLKPSLVSELAQNVCKARKIQNNCKVASVGKNTYEINHNGKTVKASCSPVDSTNPKFASSNYGVFGFPDEYVIVAYESASPYAEIKKDLDL